MSDRRRFRSNRPARIAAGGVAVAVTLALSPVAGLAQLCPGLLGPSPCSPDQIVAGLLPKIPNGPTRGIHPRKPLAASAGCATAAATGPIGTGCSKP